MNTQLDDLTLATFRRDGFVVLKGLADPAECAVMQDVARMHLQELIAPIEYEIDVQYPGAPQHPDQPGSETSRRLLQAYARHQIFRDWATHRKLQGVLQSLFASTEPVLMSQCHHNCIMTKAPGFSSATLWHQDNRYWAFDDQNLISVWLALGDETKSNGCLRVIAGSHNLDLPPGRFDASLFLRPDLADNKALISQAELVELDAGDVIFFHSRLFHAAGRNLTDETKLSVVFTYHEASNRPIANSRSARFPSINLN